MTTHAHTLLTGIALLVGGLVAAGSHLMEAITPSSPGQLADYVAFTQSVHLALFAGGVLALFGWFGFYGAGSAHSGLPTLFTFLAISLGILLGDLLHCVLEFSILPVLVSLAPYAVPELKQATYGLTPFAALVRIGRGLLLLGAPATAATLFRGGVLSRWAAAPFLSSALLLIVGAIAFDEHRREQTLIALYLSMAILGIFVLAQGRKPTRSAA